MITTAGKKGDPKKGRCVEMCDNTLPFFCTSRDATMGKSKTQKVEGMKVNFELDLKRGEGAIRWSGATGRFIRRMVFAIIAAAVTWWLRH